jgi:hypothetical protein
MCAAPAARMLFVYVQTPRSARIEELAMDTNLKKKVAAVLATMTLSAGGLGAVALTAAQPAGATTPTVRVGRIHADPTIDALRRSASQVPGPRRPLAAFPESAFPLTYWGGNNGIGVVTGAPRVYLVFWGSQWGAAKKNGLPTNDHAKIAPRLVALYKGLGTKNETWSGVMTQYCEGIFIGQSSCPTFAPHVGYPTGGALAGVWVDNRTPAPGAATSTDLALEAAAGAGHFFNMTATPNRNAQYVIVSPSGTHPGGFPSTGFCAWHSASLTPFADLAFTNLPYIPDAGTNCGKNFVNAGKAGVLDGLTIVAGHEYAESITDPTMGGWHDMSPRAFFENGDKCSWDLGGKGGVGGAQNVKFATGKFAMQGTWSNDTNDCRISHKVVTP